MLAMFLFMRDFIKGKNERERDTAIAHCLDQNKSWMDRAASAKGSGSGAKKSGPRQTPSQVACIYCHRYNLDDDDISADMDWDFFADCAQDEDLGVTEDFDFDDMEVKEESHE